MKKVFWIFGMLILLAVAGALIWFGWTNLDFHKAQKNFEHGQFKTAEQFYIKGTERLPQISFIKEDINGGVDFDRALSIFDDGYFNPERYDEVENLIDQKLDEEEKLTNKDEFYNLLALVYWEKGVELFIKEGKKAANLKELDLLIEAAKDNSFQAVKFYDNDNQIIPYNYEFFRQSPKKLKQQMQQQAQQKMQSREMQKNLNKMKSEQKNEQEGDQGSKPKQGEEWRNILIPKDKQENRAEQPIEGSDKPKKKKVG